MPITTTLGTLAAAAPATRMEALGRQGLTISIVCGPCGAAPFAWSVQVLSRTGEEFTRPFTARSFDHAVEIAEMEIRKRGWLP